MIDTCIFY